MIILSSQIGSTSFDLIHCLILIFLVVGLLELFHLGVFNV